MAGVARAAARGSRDRAPDGAAGALELVYAHGDDGRVLAVGHEPSFSQVVYDLTGGHVDFKKGGIAAVRVERGSGELLALLRPRELESLARG